LSIVFPNLFSISKSTVFKFVSLIKFLLKLYLGNVSLLIVFNFLATSSYISLIVFKDSLAALLSPNLAASLAVRNSFLIVL